MLIIIVILSALEFIFATVLGISGGIFFRNHGGYPRDLIEAFSHPEQASLTDDSFSYMVDGIMGISMIVLIIKLVISQISLLKENSTRAIISFSCDGMLVISFILYALTTTGKVTLHENIPFVMILVTFVVMFLAMKGTRSGKVLLFHFIQMGVEIIVIPLIMWLSQFTVQQVVGGIIVGIILLGVVFSILGVNTSSAGSSSNSSDNDVQRSKIDNKIEMLVRNTRENKDGLKAKAEGNFLRGFHVDERVTKENISRNQREIERLVKERNKLDK